MTAQQPQREYIITEEDILILEDTFGVTMIMPRSRPHTPAPSSDEDMMFKDSIIEQQDIHIKTLNAKMATVIQEAASTATLAENKRVLKVIAEAKKKLSFDSSFATDNAYNDGRLSAFNIVEGSLRAAGEQE